MSQHDYSTIADSALNEPVTWPSLRDWQEHLLSNMLRTSLAIGSLLAMGNIMWGAWVNNVQLIQLAVAGCACLCAVTLVKGITHEVRATAFVLLLAATGTTMLLLAGVFGLLWLGAVPLVAALVQNRTAALGTAVLISLASFGLGWWNGVELTAPLTMHPDSFWTLLGLSYLGISLFVVKWCASLLRNVELLIKQSSRVQQKLQQDALYDNLTGLPNRQSLQNRLGNALTHAYEDISQVALLFIDLDNFKDVNDSHGHSLGDELLKLVALRLNQTVRIQDTVARPGGDEFVVLLTGLPLGKPGVEMALAEAERLRQMMLEPFDTSLGPYTTSISVGVTVPPQTRISQGMDMMREADIAMYEAKSKGRNRVVLFETAMQTRLQARLALERDLAVALEKNQLVAVVQSQFDADNQMAGAEMLIRWKHPEHGFISPAEFIPLAEQTGLIGPIGEWMLEQACQLIKQLQERGMDCPISVNVSPKQFNHAGFTRKLLSMVASYRVLPEYLVLEVTESVFIGDISQTTHTMNTLTAVGFRFSMDDFGTGYSSLSYLKRLPLHELKIDRSFVINLPFDNNDVAIVKMIISMAATLDLQVVAEGVETAEQAQFLRQQGCHSLQGYYFSKPMSPEEWLNDARSLIWN